MRRTIIRVGGAALFGLLVWMEQVSYRTSRSAWKLGKQYYSNINAVKNNQQRGFITHETAIREIQAERDKLHKLLHRMWWLDRLRMHLRLWLVDDMIDLLKQGSVRTVYFDQVG